MSAVLAASPLALFGDGSEFVTILLIAGVVVPIVLWVARGRLQSSGLRDLLGITAAFFVLLFVTMLMMVVEHAGG